MAGAGKGAPGGFRISGVVVPLISLGVLFVSWRWGMKWMVVPVGIFLLFYYAVLPRVVRARVARFDRRAIAMLGAGKAAEIPSLVRRSVFLQLFGPRGPLDAKLALGYAATGAHRRAIPCFERAIAEATAVEATALRAGLVKSLFVCGEMAQAEAEGRAVVDGGTRLPELLAAIARARVDLGKNDDETKALLDEAEQLSPTADVGLMLALTRIELSLGTGRKPADIPEGADSSTDYIRGWVSLVRGKLRAHRGDEKGASESYARALASSADSFVGTEARGRIASTSTEEMASGEGRDPHLERKKRKRR